jgi:Ribbon-helix-helix protein, copG family
MINYADAEYDRRERRGVRKVFIATHIPQAMNERLKATAIAEDRPISALLRRALDQYLARASEAA